MLTFRLAELPELSDEQRSIATAREGVRRKAKKARKARNRGIASYRRDRKSKEVRY